MKALPFVAAATVIASSAHLQADHYIAGSYGINNQEDSVNSGGFVSSFTTGNPPSAGLGGPLTLPAGTALGWKTAFDDGDSFNLSIGKQFGEVRLELEYAYADADVERHNGVTAGGILLDPIDANILFTGSTTDLGVTVGQVVAVGRGDIETQTLYLNAFYDIPTGTAFTPYVGAGIGYSSVDVTFQPSNVPIVSDDDDVFVYQLIVGLTYTVNDNFDVFGSLRYRDGDDAEVSTSALLPAKLDVEAESTVGEIGLRYHF